MSVHIGSFDHIKEPLVAPCRNLLGGTYAPTIADSDWQAPSLYQILSFTIFPIPLLKLLHFSAFDDFDPFLFGSWLRASTFYLTHFSAIVGTLSAGSMHAKKKKMFLIIEDINRRHNFFYIKCSRKSGNTCFPKHPILNIL